MTDHESPYDAHWRRLADLLGADEAAAERARCTADERAERARKRLKKYAVELPMLHSQLDLARQRNKEYLIRRLKRRIAWREKVLAENE